MLSILFAVAALGLVGAAFKYKQSAYALVAIPCALVFLALLWREYEEDKHKRKMIAKFERYEPIWCVDGNFALKSEQISKADGWYRENDKISNGKITLYIIQCKEQL